MLSINSLVHALVVAQALAPPCEGPLTRDAVVQCAVAASPRIAADREAIAAAEGEADAARVVLPANPTLAVTVGQRWNTRGDRSLNVSGTLSQRIEVGGQRRQRREQARARVQAQEHAAEVTTRAVVAQALVAYYDVLASREELAVIEQAERTATRLPEAAVARVEAGLGSGLDAELVAAEATTRREQLALSRGRLRVAEARLASALGLDPRAPLPPVEGTLQPLPPPGHEATRVESAMQRPELERERAEQRAERAHESLLRRLRVPSPQISVFAQTDGFDERVLGGGLSMPIPLPFPAGRTQRGEIDASRARQRRAEQRIAATQRALSLEVTVAEHELEARTEAAAVYGEADRQRARERLDALDEQLRAGRVEVRDALLARQALVDLLLRAIETRHAQCLAAIELRFAAGASFEGGAR